MEVNNIHTLVKRRQGFVNVYLLTFDMIMDKL
jgi:hypothetical protein